MLHRGERRTFTTKQVRETELLAEEQLNVGKYVFDTGTTRIRRFVIEKPVEANVTLHEEHAEVVRRDITDPAYVADIDWSDKAYEVTETRVVKNLKRIEKSWFPV